MSMFENFVGPDLAAEILLKVPRLIQTLHDASEYMLERISHLQDVYQKHHPVDAEQSEAPPEESLSPIVGKYRHPRESDLVEKFESLVEALGSTHIGKLKELVEPNASIDLVWFSRFMRAVDVLLEASAQAVIGSLGKAGGVGSENPSQLEEALECKALYEWLIYVHQELYHRQNGRDFASAADPQSGGCWPE